MSLCDGGLTIDCIVLGEIMTNCYVMVVAGEPAECCWVVDPGLSPQPLLDDLRQKKLSPQRILLTHGHGDHIAGVAAVKASYPQAVITVPAGDVPLLSDPVANMSLPFGLNITAPPPDDVIQYGQRLQLGALAGKFWMFPGTRPVARPTTARPAAWCSRAILCSPAASADATSPGRIKTRC